MTTSFLPPIALDARSKTPLYRQIAVWFQRAIVNGQLRPGQRVPSTRALADELKISRIPVLGAGVSVGPLSPCYAGAPRRNGLVLSYASLSEQQIYATVAGLRTVITAWSKHSVRA